MEVSPPEGGSPVLVKTELLAGLLERGLTTTQAEEQVSELEKAINVAILESQGELGEKEVRRLSLSLTDAAAQQTHQQAEKFVRSLSRALTNPLSSTDEEEEEEGGEDDVVPLLNQQRGTQKEVHHLGAPGPVRENEQREQFVFIFQTHFRHYGNSDQNAAQCGPKAYRQTIASTKDTLIETHSRLHFVSPALDQRT